MSVWTHTSVCKGITTPELEATLIWNHTMNQPLRFPCQEAVLGRDRAIEAVGRVRRLRISELNEVTVAHNHGRNVLP